MPSSEAKVERTISGYRLSWVKETIEVDVKRVHISSEGITGFIQITLGKAKHIEPSFKFNFSSSSTRRQLVKQMADQYTEWTPEVWQDVVDSMVRTIILACENDEEWAIIQPTVAGAKHPGYYIEPVVMKGVPNIIYGDKATMKTTLSLALLGLIANGVTDSSLGLIAQSSGKVALFDWENNQELTDYTTSRLVESQTIPYFELGYIRCKRSFAEEVERLGRFVDSYKPDVVLIDSLGKAAGSVKFDSSGKEAALKFFETLDQFPGITWLIIGQNAKDDTGKKTIFGSTYFTYYGRNILRLQRSKQESSLDERLVVLFQEEANYSGIHPPIGFKATFTDSTIAIEREEANLSEFVDRVNLSRELFEFLRTGSKSVRAIADELGLTDNRVRVLLSQLKRRNKVTNLERGLWGLPS